MAMRNILTGNDALLHKKCREVTSFDERLWTLIDDLKETLISANGLGLAAPQVGILRRVAVVADTQMHPDEELKDMMLELVNPEIIAVEGEQEGPEGCLSVPGVWGLVKRPMKVTVRACDRNGNTFEMEREGLTARAFCHEIAHLDGQLFTQVAERMLTPEEAESWGAEEDEEFEDEGGEA